MLTRLRAATGVWFSTLSLTVAMVLFSGPAARPAQAQDGADPDHRDRGDVPGWVMITVMTAIVVIALLAVFRDAVLTAVKNAFSTFTGG